MKFVNATPVKLKNDLMQVGNVTMLSREKATVEFELTLEQQESLTTSNDNSSEVNTQFTIQYDVARELNGGEVQ